MPIHAQAKVVGKTYPTSLGVIPIHAQAIEDLCPALSCLKSVNPYRNLTVLYVAKP